MRRLLRRLPLSVVFGALAALYLAIGVALAAWLAPLLPQPWMGPTLVVAVLLPLLAYQVQRAFAPMHSLFRALAGTVASYRDGDFGFSLSWDGTDELGELVAAHNRLGDALREQRLTLVQRELLLDTMVQHTPVAMLLVDPTRRIVHANLAARKLLGEGRKLEGQDFNALLARTPEAVQEAFERGGDGMFTLGDGDNEDIYHLSRRHFRLNGRRHELVLLRQLTAELRRQEVQTWKKVIRVISHELNNSLAPVASLANSGSELVRRGQVDRLPEVLATIAERARHLQGFIDGYARFAKLPTPRPEVVHWHPFVTSLRAQMDFTPVEPLPPDPASFDVAQVEQAVLNLIKNAHESGSAPHDVTLAVRRASDGVVIEVADRGPGMSDTVMANALVPFYSTKRSGTGLGLALAREIVEAHGGRITLGNRAGGGLAVALILPHLGLQSPSNRG